jgi:hypothetical protein
MLGWRAPLNVIHGFLLIKVDQLTSVYDFGQPRVLDIA